MATERTVLVRIKAEASGFAKAIAEANASLKGLRNEINTTNERGAWLAQGLLAIGPTLAPLGAAAVPVLSGIATQATVAAAAAGTLALGFHGIGDALSALNKYQLAPTAENLTKLHQQMALLGPDGQHFVRFLDDTAGKLRILQLDARAGMFPGIEDGIDRLMERLPQVRSIVQQIAQGIGNLTSQAGRNLAGPGFDDFFHFLKTDAQPILEDMGRTIGNFVQGFAHLLADFAPLSRDFSRGLLDWSRAFNDWAAGLKNSREFEDFIDYVRKSGPLARDFLGSLADALIQIAEAAGHVGPVMLKILTPVVDLIAALADSPAGRLLLLAGALASVFGRFKALGELTGSGAFSAMTKNLRSDVKSLTTGFKALSTEAGAFASNIGGSRFRTAGESVSQMAVAQDSLAAASKSAATAAEYEARMFAKLEGAQARLAATQARFAAAAGSPLLNATPARGAATVDEITAANRRYETELNRVRVAEQQVLDAEIALEAAQRKSLSTANDVRKAERGIDNVQQSRRDTLKQFGKSLGSAAIQGGVFALAMSPVPDKIGATNAAMGAMIGTIGGPWGMAIGAAVGGFLDVKSSAEQASKAIEESDQRLASMLLDQEKFDPSNPMDYLWNTTAPKEFFALLTTGDFQFQKLIETAGSWGSTGRTLQQEMRRAGVSVRELENDTNALTKAQVENAQRLQAWQESAKSAADAFLKIDDSLGGKKTFSLDKYLANYKKEVDALVEVNRNALIALGRGLDEGLVQQLQAAGPEGAKALDALAHGTDKAIDSMNADFRRGQRAMNSWKNEVTKSGKATNASVRAALASFRELPKNVRTEIRTTHVPQSIAEAKKLAKQLDLTARQRRALITLVDLASPKVRTVGQLMDAAGKKKAKPIFDADISRFQNDKGLVDRSLHDLDTTTVHPKVAVKSNAAAVAGETKSILQGIHDENVYVNVIRRNVFGKHADGGYIVGPGTGTSDSIPAYLSNGEYVVKAAAVDKYGVDTFDRLNAMAFAGGGLVPGGFPGFSPTVGKTFGEDSLLDYFRRVVAQAGESITDLALMFGQSATSLSEAAKREVRDRIAALKDLLKVQEKERDAIKDRLDAEVQLKQSIMDSVAGIIQGTAELLGTVRTPVIPAVGSNGEITWTDAPATGDSISNALDTQIAAGEEFGHLMHVLHKKGFSKDFLEWLIQNGVSLETLRDLASRSRAYLADLESRFDTNQHLQHQYGLQAAGELGVTGEIRALRKEYAEARRIAHLTEKRLEHANKQLDAIKSEQEKTTAAVKNVGHDTGDAVNGVGGKAGRRGRRD